MAVLDQTAHGLSSEWYVYPFSQSRATYLAVEVWQEVVVVLLCLTITEKKMSDGDGVTRIVSSGEGKLTRYE